MSKIMRWDNSKVIAENKDMTVKQLVEYCVEQGISLNGAELNGAELNGISLNNAELNGAELNGAELNYAELNNISGSLNGFICLSLEGYYVVCCFNGQVAIGCQQHSLEKWRSFTDEQIEEMDDNALAWWGRHKAEVTLLSGLVVKVGW